jgi:hypothetical protein
MSATIRAKLFSGALPVYCYMYTLRQFMRMNGVRGEDVELANVPTAACDLALGFLAVLGTSRPCRLLP